MYFGTVQAICILKLKLFGLNIFIVLFNFKLKVKIQYKFDTYFENIY